MLKTVNRITFSLAANLTAAATTAKLFNMQLSTLNSLAIGDHILLDLADGRGSETVQYTHAAPLVLVGGYIELPITRAVEGTALNWPARACLVQSTSEAYFAQLVCKHAGACP